MVGTFSPASKPSAGALYQLSEKKNENPCVFSMININSQDQIAYHRQGAEGGCKRLRSSQSGAGRISPFSKQSLVDVYFR